MGLFGEFDIDSEAWTVAEADKKFIAKEKKCPKCNMVLPKTGLCDDCD